MDGKQKQRQHCRVNCFLESSDMVVVTMDGKQKQRQRSDRPETLLKLLYIATRRQRFYFVGMTQSVSSVHHPLEVTETVPSLRHSSESTETSLHLQPIEEAVEQVSRGEAREESLPCT